MNRHAQSRHPARQMSYLASVIHQRCPRCQRGFVYRRTLTMNNRCPACGMAFNREPGFFTGASMIGMFIAFPASLFILWLVFVLFPTISLAGATALAFALYLPLLPLTLRLSRVLWLEIGRIFSPDGFNDAPPDDASGAEVLPAPVDPTGAEERQLPESEEEALHENERLHVSA